MRTLTSTPASRRRVSRGAGCDDMPRLWGPEAPEVPAPASPPAAVPAASGGTPALAPATAATPAVAPAAVALAPAAGAFDGPSLEDLICGAWDGLGDGTAVACPICASEMAPRWSAGAGVVGGRCGGCGTTIE